MKNRGDIYLEEIHAAILRAGGGEQGFVDVQAAVLACIGSAAALAATLPRHDRRGMVKHITSSFSGLVADARKDIDDAGMEFENVTQN